MALEVNPRESALRIRFETGVDAQGNPTYATRTYSNIKTGAADQDVYDVAVILTALQVLPVVAIERVNEVELVNV